MGESDDYEKLPGKRIRHRLALLRSVIMLLGTALGAGCMPPMAAQMYPGPKLPPNQIAVVAGPPGLRVYHVDSQEPPDTLWFGAAPKFRHHFELQLLPGQHTFEVGFTNANLGAGITGASSVGTAIFSTEVQAGHAYWIRAEPHAGQTWSVEFEEISSQVMDTFRSNGTWLSDK